MTLVLQGRLDVRLRDETAPAPHTLHLAEHQAALVRPGAVLQLINTSRFPCTTLYVVGPAYAFDADEAGQVTYADAITLDESWEELEALNWSPPRLTSASVTRPAREAALRRIRERHEKRVE